MLQEKREVEEAINRIEKDLANQKKLVDNLINPFLEKSLTKFAKFEALFSQSLVQLHLVESGHTQKTYRRQKSLDFINLLPQFANFDSAINQINVIYRLMNFVKTADCDIKLDINFNLREYEFDVNYVLEPGADSSRRELTNGNYDRIHTDEEIEELALLIANQIYDNIEQHVSEHFNQKQ